MKVIVTGDPLVPVVSSWGNYPCELELVATADGRRAWRQHVQGPRWEYYSRDITPLELMEAGATRVETWKKAGKPDKHSISGSIETDHLKIVNGRSVQAYKRQGADIVEELEDIPVITTPTPDGPTTVEP